MKFFVVIFFLTYPAIAAFGQANVDLVEREGLWYKKFSDVPFTGKIEEVIGNEERETPYPHHRLNGTHIQREYSNGILEGSYISYYDNGQLARKGRHKAGKREGLWVLYYSNGQLAERGDYKEGRPYGQWVSYWRNGNLYSRGRYANGSDGFWLDCTKDGQIRRLTTGTYKNGRLIHKNIPAGTSCK